jgi:hypothetical protein
VSIGFIFYSYNQPLWNDFAYAASDEPASGNELHTLHRSAQPHEQPFHRLICRFLISPAHPEDKCVRERIRNTIHFVNMVKIYGNNNA